MGLGTAFMYLAEIEKKLKMELLRNDVVEAARKQKDNHIKYSKIGHSYSPDEYIRDVEEVDTAIIQAVEKLEEFEKDE